MWVSGLLRLVVLGYITKSMVLVSPSVKICDFFSFFFFFFSHHWCVGCVREARKKKKKTLARHRNPASRTHSGVRHQKWHLRATQERRGGGCIFNELHGTCSLQMSRAGCHCIISSSHTIFTIQLHHHNLNQDSTISSS